MNITRLMGHLCKFFIDFMIIFVMSYFFLLSSKMPVRTSSQSSFTGTTPEDFDDCDYETTPGLFMCPNQCKYYLLYTNIYSLSYLIIHNT